MSLQNLDAYNLKQVPVGGLINEAVMKKIWDISKIPLPFSDMVGTDSHKNEHYTWTQDALATPNPDNAVIDGDDIDQDDSSTGLRVGNHSQTSVKSVKVSTRAIESDTIGRANELSYQVVGRQQELKRDIDAIATGIQASLPGTDTIAGRSAGLGAWIATNTVGGAGFGAGGFNTATGIVDAPTLGAPEALTETKVRDVAELVYNEGGNPTKLMVVPKLARKFSEYLFTASARIATLTAETNQKGPAKAVGSINIFITDFGVVLDITPNRLQFNTDYVDVNDKGTTSVAYMLDPAHLRLSYLHAPRVEDLAKTGLSEKKLMSADWTLVVTTELAQGAIFDCDNTADVTQ